MKAKYGAAETMTSTTQSDDSGDGSAGDDAIKNSSTTTKAPPAIDLEKQKKLSYELNITRGKGNVSTTTVVG